MKGYFFSLIHLQSWYLHTSEYKGYRYCWVVAVFCGEDDFGCEDNLNNQGIIFETESGADTDNS